MNIRLRLKQIIEAHTTQLIIIALIILNAIVLALETSATAVMAYGTTLKLVDQILLGVFVVELFLKAFTQGRQFYKDPWNIFDATVVGIALLPATGSLSILRSLRILRILRLISAVPSLKRVVNALLKAVPGMGSVVLLLAVIYFIFSVIATKFFGAAFADWFGDIGKSAYTLFQIMTLESWSMGIVRPVMTQFPLAWIFFIPFILITSFAVLNLFIGIIVDAMQRFDDDSNSHDLIATPKTPHGHAEEEIRALRIEIQELKQLIQNSRQIENKTTQ
ncbi:MAG: ion transporter [Pseudomonadota bacterium]|nr:ion transporter [Pseudomonadota bacterium]